MDAARKIFAAEGFKSFFKGAGANILRGVAGAGVLSIYDRKCTMRATHVTQAPLTNSQRSNCFSSERPSRAPKGDCSPAIPKVLISGGEAARAIIQ